MEMDLARWREGEGLGMGDKRGLGRRGRLGY